MVPRNPRARRRLTLMRRASVSRLTDSREDDCVPSTAPAGPGTSWTRVVVVLAPVPPAGGPRPAGGVAAGHPPLLAGPAAAGQLSEASGTPSLSLSAGGRVIGLPTRAPKI